METQASKREVRDGLLVLKATQDGSVCTLALAGELDLANAESVTRQLERLESADVQVEIDLSELEFIDSTGIAILVAAHHRLDGDGRLRIVPSRAYAVQRVMAVTGLDRELPFTPSADGDGASADGR